MSPENSRFWLQQYARGGNGAKGEAEGGGRRWRPKVGELAGSKWARKVRRPGGGTERLRKDGVDCDYISDYRFVPYVPVRRGTTCNFKIRTDAAAIDVAAAQYTGILFY